MRCRAWLIRKLRNTEGTLNVQPRIHKFDIAFTPQPDATLANPSGPNLIFTYLESILLYGPDGTPCTSLDADGSGHLSYPGFPDLPVSTYPGDGFGGGDQSVFSKRIPLDCEGLVLNDDGTFWVSDEYGPYVYHFSRSGRMIHAIRPNDAIIPMRNGTESFSADSPPHYVNNGAGDDVIPANNPTGRDNNQGFEGMTITGDGHDLYVLLQSAINQEGGLAKQTNRNARLLKFDMSTSAPRYASEYVVPLPQYNDPTAKPSKNPKTAAQSEIHYVQGGQFFVLARDSGAGHGQSSSLSVYRHVDVFDTAGATDLKSPLHDCFNCSIASLEGVLDAGITPTTYCSFLDFNVNSQLGRFGLHNGGPQDQFLLNEKWESLALVPVDGGHGECDSNEEYFLFSLSDNDFITQNGFYDFGMIPYKDDSGFNLDNQALVFKIQLPKGSKPFG
jgi:hypothetical protein